MSPPARRTAAGSQMFRRETRVLLQRDQPPQRLRVSPYPLTPSGSPALLQDWSASYQAKQGLAAVDASTKGSIPESSNHSLTEFQFTSCYIEPYWHHQFDGHGFEQAPGVGDGQACCSPQGRKE